MIPPQPPEAARPTRETPEVYDPKFWCPKCRKHHVNPCRPTPETDAARLLWLQWHTKHGHEKTVEEKLDTMVNDPRPVNGWQVAEHFEVERDEAREQRDALRVALAGLLRQVDIWVEAGFVMLGDDRDTLTNKARRALEAK